LCRWSLFSVQQTHAQLLQHPACAVLAPVYPNFHNFSGLLRLLSIDPTVVQLLFVLGLLLGFGAMAFVYLAMIFIVPEEPVVSG
jgi:hypothetical protein